MKRIATILILLLAVATTNAQLYGKFGTMLQEQCNKGNIIRKQASDLAPETQKEYKELIRKVATKELSTKCNDKEILQATLDSIGSNNIIIWEPYTTKGNKILHKQIKKLTLRNKLSVATELIMWKSDIFRGQSKSGRAQKCLGVYKDDSAITNISSSKINGTVTQMQITTITKEEEKEIFYILYYTGKELIYWSNK